MVRKRLDDRVRLLLERGVATQHRSLLVLVGDHGKDQVPNLHHILSKLQLKARPSVLWCYKKELGFSSHKQKRMKKLKRDKARGLLTEQADQFELFMTQTDITYCYYKDTQTRVLGQTFGMLVLHDFEAITPNLLARTMETVAGGGLIVVLLKSVQSLRQLYHMTMDVHARFRTESHANIVPRFNERFLLSLTRARNCLVCDDELNVLPLLSRRSLATLSPEHVTWNKGSAGEVVAISEGDSAELVSLKNSLADTPHVGALVELCKTMDQAQALMVFLDVCADTSHTTTTTVALTAARGRGKSATLGLCLAGALSLGYTSLVVTAPAAENLQTCFDFCLRGLSALHYQQHVDYNVTYQQAFATSGLSTGGDRGGNGANTSNSTRSGGHKVVMSIVLHKSHRQMLQYLPPDATDQCKSAEIVALDEAAAIPLPLVQALLKSNNADRLNFLSSTVHGYEGTGRALSLKLLQELRDNKGGRQSSLQAAQMAADSIKGVASHKGEAQVHEQRWQAAANASALATAAHRLTGPLREVELRTPIRYAAGDPVEAWLNQLLCLDAGSDANFKLRDGAPSPSDCELYSVDRDALFSYHKLSEAFLQKLMGLYTSAHYKNSPNDLQMLSDAPAHAVFVLLSPAAEHEKTNGTAGAALLPDILAVVQVAVEGQISRKAVEAQLARGHRRAGDLIPWTLAQQFSDAQFAQLSGARIVRIATHPSVQNMGYGTRAMELLYRYYNGEMVSLTNAIADESSEDDVENMDAAEESEADDVSLPADATGIHAERLQPRKELPPLLLPLTEVPPPRLDWIGTSFGLTLGLHKFWMRCGMQCLYLRQTKNELTSENSCIMMRTIQQFSTVNKAWLPQFGVDFGRRLMALLSGPFRDMSIRLALSMLEQVLSLQQNQPSALTASELEKQLSHHDLKRLELYGRNLCDHHLVSDLLPCLATLYFGGRLAAHDCALSSVQSALLAGLGLQRKSLDELAGELQLPSHQVLAMFHKTARKISQTLHGIVERDVQASMEQSDNKGGDKRARAEASLRAMRDVAATTLHEDNAGGAADVATLTNVSAIMPQEIAQDPELRSYAVQGTDAQWEQALQGKTLATDTTLSIVAKREKRKEQPAPELHAAPEKGKKSKKKTRRSKHM